MINFKNVNIKDHDSGDPKTIIANYLSDYLSDSPMTIKEAAGSTEFLIEALGLNHVVADLVAEIVLDEKWSLRRLRDAVKYILKTHRYKEIRPADILSYDRGIEFYSYNEMLEFGTGGEGFERVQIPGIPNMRPNRFDPIGNPIDTGWWVKSGTVIPETWRKAK